MPAGVKTPPMEPIESLATPTTCMGSDDGKLPQTHQRKWNAFRNGRPPVHHQSQQQQEQLLAGKGFTSVRILPTSPHHPTKKRPAAAPGRSLLKRAIHKIGKRRKRVPTPPAPIVDTDPPKVKKCNKKRGEERKRAIRKYENTCRVLNVRIFILYIYDHHI